MASLSEKVEAELEQLEQVLRELPSSARVSRLSVLELAGTASLLSACYHGVENILKQGLQALGIALPAGAAWHRDLLQAAVAGRIVSARTRDRLSTYMGFRHFFTHNYGFELDTGRLRPLVREARPLMGTFKAEVRRFVRRQDRLGKSGRTAKLRKVS